MKMNMRWIPEARSKDPVKSECETDRKEEMIVERDEFKVYSEIDM